MPRPLKEYTPKDILISDEALHNAVQDFQKQAQAKTTLEKNKELSITLGLAAISILVSFVTAFSSIGLPAKMFLGAIFLGLFIYAVVCVSKCLEAKKSLRNNENGTDLEEQIIDKVRESILYTAIVRVTYRTKDEIKYLVGNDYFLPHCTLDPALPICGQDDNIIQSLHDDFMIQIKDILKLKPVDDKVHFSIKPIRGRIQLNAYVFYDVEIKIQTKEKLIEQKEGRSWMSLENMKKTPDAMAGNKDVIDLLGEFQRPTESFVNVLGNLSVIWNITSQCDYACAICATHDETRKELSANDKLKVLNSIFTAAKSIRSLDFAGGDPFCSEDTLNIIQTAVDQLGMDKVSVTTTGRGVERLTDLQCAELVRHCEITLDASHAHLKGKSEGELSRSEDKYCETNIDQISRLMDHAESLTINIPIINDDLTDDEIDCLVEKISWIKEHYPKTDICALLIRLMPVGKLPTAMDQEDYARYNPIVTAKKIKQRLESHGIPCHPHCSLRVLPCFSDEMPSQYCAMLENKIGIDCAGNVFACAWGGYLNGIGTLTKNPFYLGNLTKVKLIDILNGISRTQPYRQIMSEIDSKRHRKFCSVISYYAKKDMFHNHDFLAYEESGE